MKILMLIYSDSSILNSIITRAIIRIPLEFTQQTLTTSARDFWSLLRTSYFYFSEARIVRGGGGGGGRGGPPTLNRVQHYCNLLRILTIGGVGIFVSGEEIGLQLFCVSYLFSLSACYRFPLTMNAHV